jgi:hypothetical protein
MIIICLFTFLFFPPCNINRALDKSRDFVNMCYVLLCVAGWLLGPHMIQLCVCVLPTERSRSVFPTYIYRREREREKVSNQTQTPFLILGCSYISLGSRARCRVSRGDKWERERERSSRVTPLYVTRL